MIERPDILDPERTPDDELIVHRGHHLRDVRAALERLLADEMAAPYVLYGPPGTGKTMVANFVLRGHRDRDDRACAYVDCWDDYQAQHLLSETVTRLGIDIAHHDSTPICQLAAALQESPGRTQRIVILDELDMVHEPDALATLADAPQLHVVAIVNNPEAIETLVAEAWGQPPAPNQSLQFGTYSVRRLVDILTKRAEAGLRVTVPESRLEHIAEAAAGDARLGITTLRAAAHHADNAGTPTITTEQISRGVETARRELHQALLARLTDHQRALYDILKARGELAPRELYEHYCDVADDPRSRTSVNKYLRKMTWYGLLTSEGTTKNRVYRLDDSGYANLDTA